MNLKKSGFTLVELLCVIVILALITVIATTGIIKLSKSSNENMYCAKLEIIESAAKDYAKKYERELNNSNVLYQNYKSLTITVNDLLVNGNLEPDKDNFVLNPIDNSSLNSEEIIIYLKNNNINIYIDSDNIC